MNNAHLHDDEELAKEIYRSVLLKYSNSMATRRLRRRKEEQNLSSREAKLSLYISGGRIYGLEEKTRILKDFGKEIMIQR